MENFCFEGSEVCLSIWKSKENYKNKNLKKNLVQEKVATLQKLIKNGTLKYGAKQNLSQRQESKKIKNKSQSVLF